MSKTSRLARPPSIGAGSKLPSAKKECPGMVTASTEDRVGEKLMKAGSNRQKSLATDEPQEKSQSETQAPGQTLDVRGQNMELVPPKSRISPLKASSHKQTKSNLKVTSSQDAEHIGRKQASPNGTPPSRDTKGNRTVPRRHTLGGARGSREILAMQPSDMDKKREAFLEHLKQKYPHHASAIMGHQERLREQSRSPKHSPNLQHSIGDQVDHLSLASLESLDAMSETEAPAAFTRGSRVRASLPVVRSSNQTKDRSLGVLYLQYGDETKQIRMPNEITGIDTVRALFVGAFPQQLTMKMLESPSVAVYVKDDMRNMYYELTDVRNITDHSCLKVYHKDPAQAFSHGPRPANSDVRMHNEMVQASRNGQPPLRQPPMVPPTHHPIQGALSPSTQSMPSSPSRIPYGSRQGSLPSSATMPRERISTANPPARSISPCPSAILERRDVKPDEDTVGKSHSLARGNEGLYADPYLIQETRLSMASAHGPHPSLGLDGPEHVLGGFHRASIRSASSYGGPSPTDTMDHASLYRQKTRNSQLPTLGSKTPPPSPHRMTEVRIIDIHGIPPQGVPIERSSPVRQSFRKEEMTGTKPRNNMGSPVIPDLQGPIPPAGDQTRERMKAMEQQIASLTGLVQHALLKAPNTSGAKEPLSERPPKTSSPAHSAHTSGGSPVLAPKSSAAPSEKGSVPLKVNLLQFRKNVSDLRMQLHQMRQLQLQNQEALRIQLERAEQEISVKLGEAMRRLEDPVQRQRTVVEEDRNKYLVLEEFVLQQLSELEQYVGSLQKDSAATHRVVTLKDVEEGAVTLRKVGESLAGLKGEFPNLQTRMRAVLRVEVEAVKFLKEEPHKLDSMLKRVKSLTDTLSSLRRCATEGPQKGPDPCAYVPVDGPSSEALAEAPLASVQLGSTSGQLEPQSSTIRSEVMPSSPVVIHHIQSFPVHIQQSQQSAALTAQPSPPLTPSPTQVPSPKPTKRQDQESLNTGASDPPGPICHKKAHENPVNNINSSTNQNLVIEELQSSQDKSKQRAMSIEAVEKEWQERRQNMDHYDGKEFEKILQEAQANMMKGIPCLEIEESPALPPAASVEQANLVESPSEESQSELHADKPVIKGPEKLPQPVVEKPTKSSKTAIKPVPIDTVTKQMFEKPIKSPPPPPPPRKTYSTSGSGITTTRSGEVVYTSRKESVSAQDGEEEVPPSTPQAKSSKIPPEIKPKPATPPPVTACVTREEEDEGDKIMAELQVFQKCTVKDVGVKNLVEPTTRIEPQIRELRPGAILPLKEKKSSEPCQEDKDPDTDENGNTTVRQSQGVIYYVTGQIHKDHPSLSGREEIPEHREPTQSPTQNTSVASPTSRMPVPLSAKSRQSPGTTDKAGKQQKLQDAQRQFRQANGSAKRVGGDHKTTSPTIPISKIPAFYPSSTKGSSQSAQNSDATNPINPSPCSSVTKPSILSSSARSSSLPSSHIPSLSNGSLKLPTHSQHTGKALSFSSQTQNGRVHSSSSSFSSSSSSSSSPSPLSPTPLGPGGKSIRTIHTPSFTSYRSHNGSSGKSCIPTVTAAKDTT
uniref:Actin interacting protein 3-like C-terminal domain-containing protein n=1 Tax=Monopterus albus TaxID=43700 RepID=A0A3Q3QFS3_MONAL